MGPTLFVHLPCTLSPSDTDALHNWLSQTVFALTRTGDDWEFEFGAENCTCSLAVVPFGRESAGKGRATESYRDDEEKAWVMAFLGHFPLTSFQLDNYCKRDHDGHKRLAQMAAHLARRFGGAIEMGIAVASLVEEREAAARQPPLPGRWAVLVSRNGDKTYTDYLIDADLLETWIQHPHFWLQT